MLAKIVKSIPLPKPGKTNLQKYPLDRMKVGDMFQYNGTHSSANVNTSINNHLGTREGRGKKFSTRRSILGVKVWRTR